LQVWKGREGRVWKKKEGVSERNGGHWEEGLLGVYFFSKYKTLLVWGNLKIVLEESFGEFI